MNKYDLSVLSAYLPNLQAFYDLLSDQKGYYLPDFTSKIVTANYLLQVVKKEVFSLKQDDMRIGKLHNKAKISELVQALQEYSELPLGIDNLRYPNKQWLVNCLHSVCPKHQLFKNPDDKTGVSIEFPEDFFEDIEMPRGKYRGHGLFKRTKQQKKDLALAILRDRNAHKDKVIKSLKRKITDLEEKLEKKGKPMLVYSHFERQDVLEVWEQKKQHGEKEVGSLLSETEETKSHCELEDKKQEDPEEFYVGPTQTQDQDILEESEQEYGEKEAFMSVTEMESQYEFEEEEEEHREKEIYMRLAPIEYQDELEEEEQEYSGKEVYLMGRETECELKDEERLDKDISMRFTKTESLSKLEEDPEIRVNEQLEEIQTAEEMELEKFQIQVYRDWWFKQDMCENKV